MKRNKNKSIYFIIWNTKKCGGHKVIFEHANRFVYKGYDVKVISILGGNVNWFPAKFRTYSLFKSFFLSKPDVLIATFYPTAYVVSLYPARDKYYLVQGWEADFTKNPVVRLLINLSFKLPLNLLAISNYLINLLLKLDPHREIVLIPQMVDLSSFIPMRVSRKAVKEIRILSVISNFIYPKGVDLLIKIAKQLKKENYKLHFILISFEKSKPSEIIDEFISDPSPEKLLDEYQKANIFLMTSRSEGFGIAPLEAMACGCPVITTDSGGINEYARNNYNCLMGKNGQEVLDNKMVQRVLNDKRLRNKIINNGLKTAANFNPECSNNIFEKVIFPND